MSLIRQRHNRREYRFRSGAKQELSASKRTLWLKPSPSHYILCWPPFRHCWWWIYVISIPFSFESISAGGCAGLFWLYIVSQFLDWKVEPEPSGICIASFLCCLLSSWSLRRFDSAVPTPFFTTALHLTLSTAKFSQLIMSILVDFISRLQTPVYRRWGLPRGRVPFSSWLKSKSIGILFGSMRFIWPSQRSLLLESRQWMVKVLLLWRTSWLVILSCNLMPKILPVLRR